MAGPAARKEFFTVKTVARGASPGSGRRGAPPVETVAAGAGARPRPGRSRSPRRTPCPGFDRSSVDGYAVRAPDTYGASEGIPGYLSVTGAVAMGARAEGAVAPGSRGRDPDRRGASRRAPTPS